jgi:acetyltransferase-like isoleucine patch superfamily enzyme
MINKLILHICNRYFPLLYAKKLGVKFGDGCRFIGFNNFGTEPYLISIGRHVSITNTTFITHDGGVWVFREKEPDIDIVGQIKIGNNVFIGSKCIILPNTVVGDNIIIGAGSVVRKELKSGFVYAGNPVKVIRAIDEYRSKNEPFILKTKRMNSKGKKEYLINNFS